MNDKNFYLLEVRLTTTQVYPPTCSDTISVTPHSQNGPGALPGARPLRYNLPLEAVEVPTEALEIEKR